MDSHKVEMLRSVKGKDMLMINDYLYHYDDRNSKAYRWVCSRRKDKPPCRVRVYTTLIDEWDLTRHKLETLVGEHPHGPAEQEAIIRARDKKRQADAEGLPCTLSNKSLKRKYQRQEEQKRNSIKKQRTSGGAGDTSNEDDGDDINDIIVLEDIATAKPKTTTDKSVLMLKTTKGYHMVAVEGCVYRLDGKSMFSCTYRWKCFRSKDLQCTGRIYTECLANGMHRFKPFRVEENKHNHQPYSDAKIEALIKRNNIKILQGKDEVSADKVFEGAQKKTPKEKTTKGPVQLPLSVSNGGGDVLSISTNINVSPKPSVRRERAKATAALYRYVEDPTEALTDPKDGDITKFSFLPSLKGNRILVMENMIFHYDSRGSLNDRAYWTCLYRRDKKMKCNCRLTTEFTGADTQIVKVSGDHTHELDHREQIDKRLKMDISMKEKRAAIKVETDMSMDNDDNSLYKSDESENDDNADDHHGGGDQDASADFTEVLQMNIMKKEKDPMGMETMQLADLDDHLESNIMECKIETDPFHETIEYVEVERVNTSQYHTDYESEHEESQDYLHTLHAPERPKRKTKKSYNYEDDDDTDYSPPNKKQTKQQTILGKISKNTPNISSNPDNIDITKTSKLRSAKGGELLCVDGYIYHLKSISPTTRTYWACIKSKDRKHKCPARVTTVTTDENKLKVVHLSNSHSHPISEDDIKKRLFNEFSKSSPKTDLKTKHIMEKSLSELNPEFAQMLGKHSRLKQDKMSNVNMKLYSVSDGPPSLAVRMCLKALKLPYELHNVDYVASEHLSDEYAKLNPQKEIPVLDDDGFYLPESIAIMQYLCDKYAPHTPLYPKDPKERALVNHRLCFNMGFYYSSIGAYTMAPIFFDYQRTEMGLKKVNNALSVFETYLQRLGTKYAAGNHVTIADFGLIAATLCLEAIGFDLSAYPLITNWYQTFKTEHSDLWDIANGGMQEIKEFEQNPPDLSHMNHPFHPTRKSKA